MRRPSVGVASDAPAVVPAGSSGPTKRPRPIPAGPLWKDVVVEFLAHDSSPGPAEAGHVFTVGVAYARVHEPSIPRQPRQIKELRRPAAEHRVTMAASSSNYRSGAMD